jgi:DNA-binding NarL/FixJ family response regulator
MTPISVLIVDDHEVVRMGLRAMLAREPDIAVVGEAGDGEQAVTMTERLRPDVVVLDVRLGATDGIAACRRIVSDFPGTGVLMFTSFGTEEAVLASLMAGASGFLLKNCGIDDILRAIRAVAAGDSLLDPAVTRKVTARLVALASEPAIPELASLSARERAVLVRLAHGETNRQIAERLVISESTARNHVSSILGKLNLSRRSEAASLATRLGLFEQD